MTLKTINFRNKISFDTQKEREVKIMILLLSVLMSSLIFGIALANQNKELFISIYNKISDSENSFFYIFINSFIINSVLLFIIFSSGFSSIGIPAVISVIVIKALSIGSYSAFFVSEYSLTGIGIYMLTLFPSNIITFVLLLLASDYSIMQSIDILHLINDKNEYDGISVRRYIYKNIIISCFMLFAAFTDALLLTLFGKYL